MILLKDILQIHNKSIEDYGGGNGIRDIELLKSAIARPFQTFDTIEMYPTVFEKAAALAESLIINHPFVDGNKRTGFAAMYSLLINYNYKIIATQEDLYQFIISISNGSVHFEEIVVWLKHNTNHI